MNNNVTIKRTVLIVAIILMIPPLINFIFSLPYYSDIEIAIKNNSRSRNHVTMATINGNEGVVFIALCDNDTIGAYTFHTKTINGNIKYKVAKETGLSYIENSMVKINTAPRSTEQIVYGIGEALARECSEITGLSAEFVRFGNIENQYTIWYIISTDGLDVLPALQLSVNGVSNQFPSIKN